MDISLAEQSKIRSQRFGFQMVDPNAGLSGMCEMEIDMF